MFLGCCDNDLKFSLENYAQNLDHKAEKLQEKLNKIFYIENCLRWKVLQFLD